MYPFILWILALVTHLYEISIYLIVKYSPTNFFKCFYRLPFLFSLLTFNSFGIHAKDKNLSFPPDSYSVVCTLFFQIINIFQ